MLLDKKWSINYVVPVPEVYDAYAYEYDVEKPGAVELMHYIGYHVGPIDDTETGKYNHSSNNPDFHRDLEEGNARINIIGFGTKKEMANLEHKMLKKVDAKNNPLYYNNNNGGGKHCQLVPETAYDHVLEIVANIKRNDYSISLYSRSTIIDLVDNKSFLQVRTDEYDTEHIKVLVDRMTGKTADTWEPIVVFAPKVKGIRPLIVGGIHSSHACKKNIFMNGLRAVEIPYKVWSKLTKDEMDLLGKILNSQPEKPRKSTTLEEAAIFVVGAIQEKMLYKNHQDYPFDVKPAEPDWKHQLIVKSLEAMGFGYRQRRTITDNAKKKWKEKRLKEQGTNFVNWGDASLKENPRLTLWLEQKEQHLMSTLNIDRVIKISCGDELESQINKKLFEFNANNQVSGHPTRVYILFYFTEPKADFVERKDWQKSWNAWNYRYEKATKHLFHFEWEFLPDNLDDIKLPELPQLPFEDNDSTDNVKPVILAA